MSSNKVLERPSKTDSTGSELYESLFNKFKHVREEQQENVTKKQINYYKSAVDSFRTNIKEVQGSHSKNKTGRLLKGLEDYDTKYHSLLKGLNESFMLFVVGTGNYGKSTLINALLETKAAEVGVLPKTWKIDIFRKDLPTKQVLIKFRNNTEKKVSAKEAQKIIEIEEKKRKESEDKVSDKLRMLKKELTDFKAFKELKLKLEREEIYNSDIVEMHWGMKKTAILEDFYIVDTPGLTQSIMGEVRNSVQDYYHKADGVLWMLDATSIAASNAKKLVADLEESLSKVGGKQQRNIIAVLNRMDLVYKNQGEEGVKQVLADTQAIYKGYFRAIIPFSAEQAFQGKINKDSQLIQKSGLNKLLTEIQEAFLKNAKSIQYNKKLESSSAYNNEIAGSVKEYTKLLKNDLDKYNEELDKAYNHIQSEAKKLLKDTMSNLSSYKKQVRENINNRAETLYNIKDSDEQKRYVNNKIFETDRLTSKLEDIQKKHNKALTDLADYYIKKIYFTEYPNLQSESSAILQSKIGVNVKVGRDQGMEGVVTIGSGILAGMFAAAFLGPLGLLVGGIVSWFARKSMIEELRVSLISKLDETFEDIEKKLKKSIESVAKNAHEEIISSSTHSFAKVYSFDEYVEEPNEMKKAVKVIINEAEELIQTLENPPPNYYFPLKDILFS